MTDVEDGELTDPEDAAAGGEADWLTPNAVGLGENASHFRRSFTARLCVAHFVGAQHL